MQGDAMRFSGRFSSSGTGIFGETAVNGAGKLRKSSG